MAGRDGLLSIPGFVLLFMTCAGVAVTLGIVSARFRDVPPIIAMVIQFTFFFTPIIWQADQMPARAAVVDYNPFYYLLEVVRAPLLGQGTGTHVWIVACCLAGRAGRVRIKFYARFRHRIAYWV